MIHPFLFSIYPVLYLYSSNLGEAIFAEALRLMVWSLVFTILLLVISKLILKDWLKAGIPASIFVPLFYSFTWFLTGMGPIGGRYLYTYIVLSIFLYVVPLTIIVIVLRKTKNFPISATKTLNLASATLIIMALLPLAQDRPSQKQLNQDDDLAMISTQPPKTLPDVYYIILDAYGSAKTLESLYDFSNEEFIRYLESKGFYVASESASNYPSTTISLASSMNMQYVHEVDSGEDHHQYQHRLLNHSRVGKYFKSLGYKFIHIGSGYYASLLYNRSADSDLALANGFELTVSTLSFTPLEPLGRLWGMTNFRDTIFHAFEKLAEIPDMQEPTFTFAHLLIPHDPFVFRSNGDEVPAFEGIKTFTRYNGEITETTKKLYIDQLIYTNGRIREIVEKILSKSDPPPIVILQGDHGPMPGYRKNISFDDFKKYEGEELYKEIMREKFRILNAFYLPGGGEKKLYSSISPVNTFRIIFNHYFGQPISLLRDESFAFVKNDKPVFGYAGPKYEYTDVTDVVLRKRDGKISGFE